MCSCGYFVVTVLIWMSRGGYLVYIFPGVVLCGFFCCFVVNVLSCCCGCIVVDFCICSMLMFSIGSVVVDILLWTLLWTFC